MQLQVLRLPVKIGGPLGIAEIIQDYKAIVLKGDWTEVEKSLGMSPSQRKGVIYEGKIPSLFSLNRLRDLLSNISMREEILYFSTKYPSYFRNPYKKTSIDEYLYEWIELQGQKDGKFNRLLRNEIRKRFFLTYIDKNGRVVNFIMIVRRVSEDAKLIKFKTARLKDGKFTKALEWEIVSGFLFDIGGGLFAFGKFDKGLGLRATQLDYTKRAGRIELRGLRLSNFDGSPNSYKIAGVELPKKIDGQSILNALKDSRIEQFESSKFMIDRYGDLVRYLDLKSKSDS